MQTLVTVLHILICLFMIFVVLLQPGKGGDVSSAFGGGSSQTVFGARGATTFLQRLTSYVAIMFILTTISLAYFSNADVSTGSVINKNLLQEFDKTKTEKKQAPSSPVAPVVQEGAEESVNNAPSTGANVPASPSTDTANTAPAEKPSQVKPSQAQPLEQPANPPVEEGKAP